MKTSDKYNKIVEWSDEDDCYIGTCPTLFGGGVHGDEEAAVYNELCEVVDEVIEIYKSHGDPLPKPDAEGEFSGKFVLRVGPELHHVLYLEALRNNESLNSYCVRELAKNHYLSPRRSARCKGVVVAKR